MIFKSFLNTGDGGEIPEIKNTSEGITYEVGLPDTYNVPVSPSSGLQNNTFQLETGTLRGRRAIETFLNKAKEIVFPEYYENATLDLQPTLIGTTSPLNQNTTPGSVKTLTFKGDGILSFGNVLGWESLETINAANIARFENTRFTRGQQVTYDERTIKIYVNKASIIKIGNYGDSDVVPEVFNSSIETAIVWPYDWSQSVETQYGCNIFPFNYGNTNAKDIYHLNGCKKYECMNYKACSIFYLPAIEEIAPHSGFTALAFQPQCVLYLGPNLTRLSGTLTDLVNNTGGIHIPAGDTATKITLDTYNIPYTQDYAL